ncbi:MAG: FISUMP domain-containing protein [Campylobacterota bacterium]|nr:FISUMP domain-containing protein [Campylobacterota bacterium]
MYKSFSKVILISLLYSINSLGQEFNITNGWQLKGASEDITSMDGFNNKCIDTIWTYNNNSWKIHITNNENYNIPSSIGTMNSLNAGDGFWINANSNCSVDTDIIADTTTYNNDGTITFKGLTYETITSQYTGKVWLDRNLGAKKSCQSYSNFTTKEAYVESEQTCFGDYYQWGRAADGHEKAISEETTTKSSTLTPDHDNFIRFHSDWTSVDSSATSRSSNWDICPTGFRVPTYEELLSEFKTPDENIERYKHNEFKLANTGYRVTAIGTNETSSFRWIGEYGHYWTSSISEGGYFIKTISIGIFNKTPDGWITEKSLADYYSLYEEENVRGDGYVVRCIKD